MGLEVICIGGTGQRQDNVEMWAMVIGDWIASSIEVKIPYINYNNQHMEAIQHSNKEDGRSKNYFNKHKKDK